MDMELTKKKKQDTQSYLKGQGNKIGAKLPQIACASRRQFGTLHFIVDFVYVSLFVSIVSFVSFVPMSAQAAPEFIENAFKQTMEDLTKGQKKSPENKQDKKKQDKINRQKKISTEDSTHQNKADVSEKNNKASQSEARQKNTPEKTRKEKTTNKKNTDANSTDQSREAKKGDSDKDHSSPQPINNADIKSNNNTDNDSSKKKTNANSAQKSSKYQSNHRPMYFKNETNGKKRANDRQNSKANTPAAQTNKSTKKKLSETDRSVGQETRQPVNRDEKSDTLTKQSNPDQTVSSQSVNEDTTLVGGKKLNSKPLVNIYGATENFVSTHFIRHVPGTEKLTAAIHKLEQSYANDNSQGRNMKIASLTETNAASSGISTPKPENKSNFWKLGKEQFDLLLKIFIFGSIGAAFVILRFRSGKGKKISRKY